MAIKMPKMPKMPKMGGAMGGAAIGLGGTGLLLASQLGTEAIRAGAAVGGAAIGADLLKDLFSKPEALMAVGAVALIFLLK
jgi:hypothetical protein